MGNLHSPYVDFSSSLFDKGTKERFVDWIMGCNMSFRLDIVLEAGGFREALGRAHGKLMSLEDIDLAGRVRSMGYSLLYTPKAVVYHKVWMERLTLLYQLRRSYWNGVSTELMSPTRITARRIAKLFHLSIMLFSGKRLDRLEGLAYELGRMGESLSFSLQFTRCRTRN